MFHLVDPFVRLVVLMLPLALGLLTAQVRAQTPMTLDQGVPAPAPAYPPASAPAYPPGPSPIRLEFHELEAELRVLQVENSRRGPVGAPLAVTLTGAAVGIISLVPMIFWHGPYVGPSHGSGEPETPPRALRSIFWTGQAVGGLLTVGGLVELSRQLRKRPHRARIHELELRRKPLLRLLKLEERERRRRERLQPDAYFSSAGANVSMRYYF